jgi:hypothetical protein
MVTTPYFHTIHRQVVVEAVMKVHAPSTAENWSIWWFWWWQSMGHSSPRRPEQVTANQGFAGGKSGPIFLAVVAVLVRLEEMAEYPLYWRHRR